MSNRLLGLLIIFGFIMAGIGFYLYAFVNYTGIVVINTNVGDYSVELNDVKTLKKINVECESEKCEMNDIPPFTYDMNVRKEGYKTYSDTVSVERSEIKSLVFVLEKNTKLVGIDSTGEVIDIAEEYDEDNGDLANSERIKEELEGEKVIDEVAIALAKKEKLKRLQNKRKAYSYFEILNFGEIFFKLDGSSVKMYIKNELGKEKLVTTFPQKVKTSQIKVQEVFGNNNKIFINYGDERFIYNNTTADLDKISLDIPVNYVKTYLGKSLAFVTGKGTFIYKNKKFEYFSLFKDFVYTNGNYIGIVDSGDSVRKKNLNFGDRTGDLVVLQNPETKIKRVLYKPGFKVEKILLKNSRVVLEDNKGKEFSLENY